MSESKRPTLGEVLREVDDPPTTPESPNALAALIDRVLANTGLTRELAMQTPLPSLVAIGILLDDVERLRALLGAIRK